jgi:hypothetical protein
MRERADLKSPVREYRSPGSVRGAPGNRRPYLDKSEGNDTPEYTRVHQNPPKIEFSRRERKKIGPKPV